jgi:hypothetical protein
VTELFYWQAAALFWVAVCFFRVGAIGKGIKLNRTTWSEIGQAALIVVLLFGLLTEGRGCRGTGSGIDTTTCVGETWC